MRRARKERFRAALDKSGRESRAARPSQVPAPDSMAGISVEGHATLEGDRAPTSSKRRGKKRVGFVGMKRLIALVAAIACASLLGPLKPEMREKIANMWSAARTRVASLAHRTEAKAPPTIAPAVPAKPKYRAGRGPLAGGVFHLPNDLRVTEDGAVDVLIHFHGNTEMVIESTEYAHLGAACVVVNLGIGSGPYETHFDNPVSFTDLRTRILGALEKRGIEKPKIGRLALSSWSAGYGAILRILKNGDLADSIDSVILLDGMHVGYREDGSLNWISIGPFESFADRAIRGEKLFLITHSNIEPEGYLGVKETTNHILEKFGMQRTEATGLTSLPPLRSFKGVLPKDQMIPLTRASEAKKGDFIVRGFRGNEPHTHMAHLMEMSEIALSDLATRWTTPR